MTFTVPRPEQPGASVLVALFEHNAWASLKLLDFCEGLTDEQLGATTVGAFGTIRATLAHLIFGEVSYVERVNGKLPTDMPPKDVFPAFQTLKDIVQWTGEEMLQLALSTRVSTVVLETYEEGSEEYKLADLMVQAVSHSIEHRTQISTIITQLGMEPPDMSGWQWMVDKDEIKLTRNPKTEEMPIAHVD